MASTVELVLCTDPAFLSRDTGHRHSTLAGRSDRRSFHPYISSNHVNLLAYLSDSQVNSETFGAGFGIQIVSWTSSQDPGTILRFRHLFIYPAAVLDILLPRSRLEPYRGRTGYSA